MKKIISSVLILALAFSSTAQQKKQNTKSTLHEVKKEATPATIPVTTSPPKKEENSEAVIINPNAAKMNFKDETYDFREIPEGPQVTHEFKFSNTGKEPLILSNVHASCGCTTPTWPKEPVLPGKDAVILVTYNTQGRPGVFTKSITISSNSDQPNKVIFIKGEVIKAEPEKSVPLEQPGLLSPKN